MEEEKHQIEIGFLRGQINDHFTYNILNMFHSQAALYSDQLADDILELSELMRYSVSEKENTMATLDEEIHHTKSLITLNQRRFGEKAQVHFEVVGNTTGWQVPHLSMLTIVENCFKHGAITKGPLSVRVEVSEKELRLRTQNHVKSSPTTEASTGLGLKNLGRRLELLCPGRTSLRWWKEDKEFVTELKITK
ncbi:MAG: histidine kinase [Spirosomaceae bacterium]|nr:histidine kinase [Spirosomataceae bacterium]